MSMAGTESLKGKIFPLKAYEIPDYVVTMSQYQGNTIILFSKYKYKLT